MYGVLLYVCTADTKSNKKKKKKKKKLVIVSLTDYFPDNYSIP